MALGTILLDAANALAAERDSPFPTPETLQSLGQGTVPHGIFEATEKDVPEWELSGPFPDAIDPAPFVDTSLWGTVLKQAAEKRAGLIVPTEAMHCVAREIGLFYFEHEANPTPELRRFITARCNAASVGVSTSSLYFRSVEDDQAVMLNQADRIQEMLEKHLVGGPLSAGVWYGRRADTGLFVVASGRRRVQFEKIVTERTPGEPVRVRGTLLNPSESVSLLANRGEFGVEVCQQDDTVRLPHFSFTCEHAGVEESVQAVLLAQPAGRFVAHSVLDLMFRPKKDRSSRYRRVRFDVRRDADDPAVLERAAARIVNQIREQAGLTALEFSSTQSEVGRELAPHLMASISGNAPGSTTDLVMLGMMAGWRVEDIVQSGAVAWGWSTAYTNLERLIRGMLESPAKRASLLDPEARTIAVGALSEARSSASLRGLLIGTYQIFGSDEHEAHVASILRKLETERRLRNTRSPVLRTSLSDLCLEAAIRIQRGTSSEEALHQLLQDALDQVQRPVSGWISETTHLGDIELPEPFLSSDELDVAIAVAFRKPDGEPWGRYIVLIVAVGPELTSAELVTVRPELPASGDLVH